jgi:hypothetical protein
MSDKRYDGVSALDQGRLTVEPIRARTDEGLKEAERRGDFPNTLGPLGGQQRTVLTPLSDDESSALQQNEELYDALDAHEKERAVVKNVTTWKETGRGDLPVDVSSTAPDRPDLTDNLDN